MSNEELRHAEAQWREAVKKGDLYDAMYWRGFIEGHKVRNSTCCSLNELQQVRKENS